MTAKQENINKIERGRAASVALDMVTEFLSEQRTSIIAKLISNYRGSSLTHDQIMGAVGELTALSNLESDLSSAQRQGYTASEMEFGENGEKAN